MKGRRRTYRAHGSITAYLSSNCHVEIFCEEVKERVKKEKKKKIKKLNLLILGNTLEVLRLRHKLKKNSY